MKTTTTIPVIKRQHTCDTFLNPNLEIRNFWSGNLCPVSGGFHVANFGLTKVKVEKSSDIARNMLPSITMLTYANRSEKMLLLIRLQFKKPPLMLF